MTAKYLVPGRSVRIQKLEQEDHWMLAPLLKSDDEIFLVQVPESFGELKVGSRVRLQTATKEGLHTCHAQVEYGETSLITFRRVGDFLTRQQRRYYRVRMTEPLELEALHSESPFFGKKVTASAVDLSIGGVGLQISQPLPLQETFRIHRLSDSAGVGSFEHIEARVRYCIPNSLGQQAVGMEFQALSLADQDRLAAWVVKLQLNRPR